jgi:uncharacterized protein
MYEIKSVSGQIIDCDVKSNFVRGYASVFNVLDADGDRVQPGAFKKSIQENGSRILHLLQHDPYRPLSSVRGGSLKLSEDEKGLSFESNIVDTSWGKDTVKLIEAGVLNENSIGYAVKKSSNQKAYRSLDELRLWEISSVSWGSNPEALNTKSVNDIYDEDFLQARLEIVTKAFRNGSFSDQTFDSLEIYLQQLHQVLANSKSTRPAPQAAAKPDSAIVSKEHIRELNRLFGDPAARAEKAERERKEAILKNWQHKRSDPSSRLRSRFTKPNF